MIMEHIYYLSNTAYMLHSLFSKKYTETHSMMINRKTYLSILGVLILSWHCEAQTNTPPPITIPQDAWTINGKTYNQPEYVKTDPECITIRHSAGVSRVPISSLPIEMQKALNYDPDKAKQYAEESRKWVTNNSSATGQSDSKNSSSQSQIDVLTQKISDEEIKQASLQQKLENAQKGPHITGLDNADTVARKKRENSDLISSLQNQIDGVQKKIIDDQFQIKQIQFEIQRATDEKQREADRQREVVAQRKAEAQQYAMAQRYETQRAAEAAKRDAMAKAMVWDDIPPGLKATAHTYPDLLDFINRLLNKRYPYMKLRYDSKSQYMEIYDIDPREFQLLVKFNANSLNADLKYSSVNPTIDFESIDPVKSPIWLFIYNENGEKKAEFTLSFVDNVDRDKAIKAFQELLEQFGAKGDLF